MSDNAAQLACILAVLAFVMVLIVLFVGTPDLHDILLERLRRCV